MSTATEQSPPLNWSAPLACEALGRVAQVAEPETLKQQRFCYFGDGKFRTYLLDGTPYNATLRKQDKYRLRNVETTASHSKGRDE